mmetsp:Transcript_32024/g.61624  ORF Transcript_32024/g.61624 Transcript_32024/m.61624 type:complete len:210 (-) Transcript_32024:626-1255(-)
MPSAVSPWLPLPRFRLAPAATSTATSSARPLRAAMNNGAVPSLARPASTSAPADINTSTTSKWPSCTARNKAVAPSPAAGELGFASAPASTNIRASRASPSIAARTKGVMWWIPVRFTSAPARNEVRTAINWILVASCCWFKCSSTRARTSSRSCSSVLVEWIIDNNLRISASSCSCTLVSVSPARAAHSRSCNTLTSSSSTATMCIHN